MSHQTGITPSQDLADFMVIAKEGQHRVFKVIIDDEQLHLVHKQEVKGTWEEDFDEMILPILEDKKPCYLFYRTDTNDDHGYKWLFISYTPDNSPVRQKMLFASTKASMKMFFGGTSVISDELAATVKSEVTLEGYRKHVERKDAPAPLTEAEMEAKMVQELETRADIGVDTKAQTLPGLAFQVDPKAIEKMEEIKNKSIKYVQLRIDAENEIIVLESSEDIGVESLPSKVPKDSPRYHFFVFPHTYEGDSLDSIVFIYSMPGYKCPVKERMLYSSCKAPLLYKTELMGMEIGAKIELEDGSELTEDFLMGEVHPIRMAHKPKFAKPKGPAGRRGQSRVTTTAQ